MSYQIIITVPSQWDKDSLLLVLEEAADNGALDCAFETQVVELEDQDNG